MIITFNPKESFLTKQQSVILTCMLCSLAHSSYGKSTIQSNKQQQPEDI